MKKLSVFFLLFGCSFLAFNTAVGTCEHNSQCQPRDECVHSRCQKKPDCRSSSECGRNSVCSQNRCVQQTKEWKWHFSPKSVSYYEALSICQNGGAQMPTFRQYMEGVKAGDLSDSKAYWYIGHSQLCIGTYHYCSAQCGESVRSASAVAPCMKLE